MDKWTPEEACSYWARHIEFLNSEMFQPELLREAKRLTGSHECFGTGGGLINPDPKIGCHDLFCFLKALGFHADGELFAVTNQGLIA